MEEAAIKTELHEIIDHADSEQLKKMYGLLTNYSNFQVDFDEWNSIPESRKARIEQSIQQANEGLGRPAQGIIRESREKYGLIAKTN